MLTVVEQDGRNSYSREEQDGSPISNMSSRADGGGTFPTCLVVLTVVCEEQLFFLSLPHPDVPSLLNRTDSRGNGQHNPAPIARPRRDGAETGSGDRYDDRRYHDDRSYATNGRGPPRDDPAPRYDDRRSSERDDRLEEPPRYDRDDRSDDRRGGPSSRYSREQDPRDRVRTDDLRRPDDRYSERRRSRSRSPREDRRRSDNVPVPKYIATGGPARGYHTTIDPKLPPPPDEVIRVLAMSKGQARPPGSLNIVGDEVLDNIGKAAAMPGPEVLDAIFGPPGGAGAGPPLQSGPAPDNPQSLDTTWGNRRHVPSTLGVQPNATGVWKKPTQIHSGSFPGANPNANLVRVEEPGPAPVKESVVNNDIMEQILQRKMEKSRNRFCSGRWRKVGTDFAAEDGEK